MEVIHKYSIPSDPDIFELELPHGATIISIQVQGHTPMMWVRKKLDEPHVIRKFRVIATGFEFEGQLIHLGTFQSGRYVWHIFEDLG
jgi:hypothetical protein